MTLQLKLPIEAEQTTTTTGPSHVGQGFTLEGGSGYQQAIKAFLARLHPAVTTIGDLPNPNENLATTSTSGTIFGNLSVRSSSMGVYGESFNDENDQSDPSSPIRPIQLDPKVNPSQAEREITTSDIPHLEPPAPDASMLQIP